MDVFSDPHGSDRQAVSDRALHTPSVDRQHTVGLTSQQSIQNAANVANFEGWWVCTGQPRTARGLQLLLSRVEQLGSGGLTSAVQRHAWDEAAKLSKAIARWLNEEMFVQHTKLQKSLRDTKLLREQYEKYAPAILRAEDMFDGNNFHESRLVRLVF